MKPQKYKREDIMLIIETLTYELGRKPLIKEVAYRMNTYPDFAKFYINKFDLRDKVDILRKGYCLNQINEEKREILREIRDLVKEMKEDMKNMRDEIDYTNRMTSEFKQKIDKIERHIRPLVI